MTRQEMIKIMERLEEYYRNFYSGADKERVFNAWYPMFQDDDPNEVGRAVVAYICTGRFAPTVADIKTLMAENRMAGQMTEMQAWQMIRDAVDFSVNLAEAQRQFDKLPPILKKLAGSPSQLQSWRNISEDTFEGVVASNVQRSYRELAKREAVFYAIPGQLQAEQTWRVEGPKDDPKLPEPEKKGETVDQILGFQPPEFMQTFIDQMRKQGLSESEIAKKVREKWM